MKLIVPFHLASQVESFVAKQEVMTCDVNELPDGSITIANLHHNRDRMQFINFAACLLDELGENSLVILCPN